MEKETYRNVEVIWPLKKSHPDFKTIADFRKNKFKYNIEKDCYICPASEVLPLHFDTVEKGRYIKYYWSTACNRCKLKPKCTQNKEYCRITRWIDEDILDERQGRIYKNPHINTNLLNIQLLDSI